MISKEDAWKQFVGQYEIDVPESKVEEELNFIMMDMRHRMRYDTLTGGDHHLFPTAELEAQMEDLQKLAVYEVKSDLVMKAVLAEQNFEVTKDELEAEAAAMAERQSTTMAMIKLFFGEDLAMLERDVKERKAKDWVYEQIN